MIDGCIPVDGNVSSTLASYAIQAELGDYDESAHSVEYFREFYLFPENLVSDSDEEKHNEKLDTLIQMTVNKYKKLAGLDTSESEQHFVQICQELPGYGEEMLPCQDEMCQITSVGSSWAGIIVRQDDFITSYKWEYVRQIE